MSKVDNHSKSVNKASISLYENIFLKLSYVRVHSTSLLFRVCGLTTFGLYAYLISNLSLGVSVLIIVIFHVLSFLNSNVHVVGNLDNHDLPFNQFINKFHDISLVYHNISFLISSIFVVYCAHSGAENFVSKNFFRSSCVQLLYHDFSILIGWISLTVH
ncbi:MAG: hypothetical protein WCG25_03835 [bacterium]